MEPDQLYALASRNISPHAAGEGVEVDGDPTVAAHVLDALSGAASRQDG
jgi:hypothetical protein